MRPFFFGKVQNGKIVFDSEEKFESYVKTLEGKEIELSVGKLQFHRTLAENRYYWGVIVKMVSDEMGLIPDEAHDYLKSLFLKRGVEHKGKRYEIIGSSASLSIEDFEDYCEKCRNWAAVELNCSIPLPNEVDVSEEQKISRY